MAGSPVPTSVDILSTSDPGIRYTKIRALNKYDDALVLHDAYSNADMVTASATAGPALLVRGYDYLDLFISFTLGSLGSSGGFDLVVESALSENGPWFERHASFDAVTGQVNASGNVTISNENHIYSWRDAATTANVAFSVSTLGHFMRFTPLAVGTSATGSRLLIQGIRMMGSS